ncbi:hypothetical protein LPB86_11785 [Pedobacter sp. MC2016-14]|uniref:hypothetical protein n=1 Tax=Pedobacter sp. MC2016-14 TaxID=2897327 RepID=UPI001E51238E|nr:hypothetical protein [Pedobacter sp. MC2016-14]MCD0488913.1 hypothetical protein [Pedobacter sp. MC2016-14]
MKRFLLFLPLTLFICCQPKVKHKSKVLDSSEKVHNSSKTPKHYPTDLEAYAASQFYVQFELDNPRSAIFPMMDGYKIESIPKDSTFKVESTVDFQNQYDIAVKKKWHCIIKYIGGDVSDFDSWKIIVLRAHTI